MVISRRCSSYSHICNLMQFFRLYTFFIQYHFCFFSHIGSYRKIKNCFAKIYQISKASKLQKRIILHCIGFFNNAFCCPKRKLVTPVCNMLPQGV